MATLWLSMPMTRVYLIRHAEVQNPKRVLYGHLSGFPLSERGRAQASALGRRLVSSGLRRIVHSPLERAQETAGLIAAELEPRPELEADPRLIEAEFSRYLQGVPYWQIPVRRPLWLVHRARRGLLPGDEAFPALGGRVLEVMRSEVARRPGEPVALVSHADPLQAAWILLEGRPHTEREMMRAAIDRAGLLEVDMDGSEVMGVRYVAPPDAAGG
ncbi:MAG TPA: histidine phosphatase family protein [Candidatus Nitrosotalea sp.]|nr:histidine phosphatase family protein [Candidatus Nitrosotalea sp.]